MNFKHISKMCSSVRYKICLNSCIHQPWYGLKVYTFGESSHPPPSFSLWSTREWFSDTWYTYHIVYKPLWDIILHDWMNHNKVLLTWSATIVSQTQAKLGHTLTMFDEIDNNIIVNVWSHSIVKLTLLFSL